MEGVREWASLAFGEYKFITSLVAVTLIAVGAMGFNMITPNSRINTNTARIESLEVRVTALESRSSEQTRMLANLSRLACLMDSRTAYTAGMDCRSLFDPAKGPRVQ